MNIFPEKFTKWFNSIKTKLASSINTALFWTKKSVSSVLDHTPDNSDKISNASAENNDKIITKKSNKLQPYSIEFQWKKMIVLWYQDSKDIYKIFPIEWWEFIGWKSAEQITALYQTHRRAFFKKIKNTTKNKNYIKNIFIKIWNSNKKDSQNDNITQQIQPKKSLSDKILEKKKQENLRKIQEKQKQKESIQREKNQEIHKSNLNNDYETLAPFNWVISRISKWQNHNWNVLSFQEEKDKKQQILSASSVFKIMMAHLPAWVFQTTIWLDDVKKYKILKSHIKKYLNQDFWTDQEIQSKQRHLHHLVNSACEILILSVQYKKNTKKTNEQWTDFYENAA